MLPGGFQPRTPWAENVMGNEADRYQVHSDAGSVTATTLPSRTCRSGALLLSDTRTGNFMRARIDRWASHFRAASAAITSRGSAVSVVVAASVSCREARRVRSRDRVTGRVGTGRKTYSG